MASLRDSVKDYQEELRDGIAWVAFWKEGRSWNAELFHLEVDGTLEPFDRSRLEEIKAADPTVLSGRMTTGFPRRLSRKQEPPPMQRGFPFPKSPTGTGKILTLMYLTGA